MMSKMIVKVMKNQLNSVLPGPCDCVFIHIKNRPTETIDIVANVARWQESLRIWLKQGKEKTHGKDLGVAIPQQLCQGPVILLPHRCAVVHIMHNIYSTWPCLSH